jgi:UDP-glucuronate 4-epimerase
MSKILLTGSAGFIGFFVAKALLQSGHTVIGVDNFGNYYDPSLKRARNNILSEYKKFVSIEIDLGDNKPVTKCFDDFKPELVCHLAAQAGVRYSLENPHAYENSNLRGFVNLIEQSRLSGIRRFVYASSSSVYGGNTKMPYSETDPVNTPVSLYAATKRANELIAYTYAHLWGLQTIGLRFFTVYGPWGRPDMAYWSFFENIINGEPIRVFNYGKNRRDFTYVDDVVLGVLTSLSSPRLDPYEIINLGNNNPVELEEFISILEQLAGIEAVKEMVGPQPGDVIATYADIEKARSKLDFAPTTSLAVGLETFVKWFWEHPGIVDSVRRFRISRKKTRKQ